MHPEPTRATLIDGKAASRRALAEVAADVAGLTARGIHPTLAVVLAGDDPASAVYVRHKRRACERTGIRSLLHELPSSVSTAEVLAIVDALNADPTVHGILVQLPLPAGVDSDTVLERVRPEKDVDGFHPANLGRLAAGLPGMVACTPAGIMRLLDDYAIPLRGREAVVIGRSRIVGRPMALLLLGAHATVTVCHSRTADLAAHVRRADVVVAAVGRPRLVERTWIKPGAAVIDVGMNRLDDGTLVGDVDFGPVSEVAGAITPVPGGVGPMTVAMLLKNTVEAAR